MTDLALVNRRRDGGIAGGLAPAAMPPGAAEEASEPGRGSVGAALIGALLGFALAGCSFAPHFERPAMPTPSTYPGAANQPGSAASLVWRDFFEDPVQRQLIAEALNNNRDIRVAAARVHQAHAQLRLANSRLFPQIDAVLTNTQSRTPADLNFTGSVFTTNDYQAVLSAAWELDFFGRLRNQRAAAFEQFLASDQGRRAVATSLIEEVSLSYLLDREYERRIAIANETLATRYNSVRIMRRRFEEGSGDKLDLEQANLLLDQAKLSLEALQGDRQVNLDALGVLVGHPVEIPPSDVELPSPGSQRPIPAGLPSELLLNRPDVVEAEHNLRASNADIGAARAAFFPDITLTGAYGTASAHLNGLFRGGSTIWAWTPTILTPLFNAGRNRANLELAEARKKEAVATYEATIQRAFRDVADALARRKQLADQVATGEDTVATLQERARLADLRYTSGRSAYLEVLDAQRDLFNSQQALVQLRRSYLSSGVSLYAALGGGLTDGSTFSKTQAIEGPTQ